MFLFDSIYFVLLLLLLINVKHSILPFFTKNPNKLVIAFIIVWLHYTTGHAHKNFKRLLLKQKVFTRLKTISSAKIELFALCSFYPDRLIWFND